MQGSLPGLGACCVHLALSAACSLLSLSYGFRAPGKVTCFRLCPTNCSQRLQASSDSRVSIDGMSRTKVSKI